MVGGPAALTRPLEEMRAAGPGDDVCRPLTVAGDGGEFHLAGLPAAEVRLWAVAPGFAWTVGEPVWIAASGEAAGCRLVLAPPPEGVRLQGRVLDPTGAGAGGAVVHYDDRNTREDGRLEADAAGRFELVSTGRGPYRLRAVDPERRLGASSTASWRAGDGPLELHLQLRREVGVRVVDEDGGPIENAWVVVSAEGEIPPGAYYPRTDAAGRVQVEALDVPFEIAAGAEGFGRVEDGPFDPRALPGEHVVRLAREPVLRGVVRAGGAPVAGAQVEVCEVLPQGVVPLTMGFPQRFFRGGLAEATTGEDGRFTLAVSRDRGELVLLASAPGWAVAELPLTLAAVLEGEEVAVELGRGGALEGRVQVASGGSPRGVVVAASRGDGHARSVRADEAGRYRFEHLTPGPWRVETRDTEPSEEVLSIAQSEEEGDFRWNCEVFEGRTTVHDLQLASTGDARLEGLFAVDGEPAVGWTAHLERRLLDVRTTPLPAEVLDGQGAFTLVAPPGRYDLVLRSPDHPGGGVSVVVEGELELMGGRHPWSGGIATGVLEGKLPEGPASLRLVRGRDGDGETATFTAAPDGTFAAAGVPAGPASLQRELERGRGWELVRHVTVVAGERTVLED